MADPLQWMPLYIADYLADTGHLGTIEHGAYFLLIMHYWRLGPLTTDDGQLRKICRMSPDEWQDARGVLLDFFVQDGNAYRHNRIDDERKEAESIHAAKRRAGSAGGKAKAKQNPSTARDVPLAKRKQKATPLPSPKPTSEPSGSSVVAPPAPKPAARTRLPDDFPSLSELREAKDFWGTVARFDLSAAGESEKFRDHHKSRGSTMADWPAAWRNWCRRALTFNRKDGGNGTQKDSNIDRSIAGFLGPIADRRTRTDDPQEPGGDGGELPAITDQRSAG